MRFLYKIRIATLFVTACLFLAGCNNDNVVNNKFEETAFQTSKGTIVANKDQTLTIHLAVNDIYCKKTACVCIHQIAAREYEETQQRLKTEFNIDLKLTYFIEEYEMEKELIAQKFDGVICKPWLAFMLSPKYGINYKRIADVLDPFKNQYLTGRFLVKKDSPIQTLADIDGKTLVMGQEDAYEKYHMPMAMLNKKNIKLKKIFQKASCLECLNVLMDNAAEVAIVSDYATSASCVVDLAQEDDFRAIGETEKIPLTSVILDMDKVSEADALRLQNALLALSGKNAPEMMLSDGFVMPAKWTPRPYVK